jgi:hypothetical protein
MIILDCICTILSLKIWFIWFSCLAIHISSTYTTSYYTLILYILKETLIIFYFFFSCPLNTLKQLIMICAYLYWFSKSLNIIMTTFIFFIIYIILIFLLLLKRTILYRLSYNMIFLFYCLIFFIFLVIYSLILLLISYN